MCRNQRVLLWSEPCSRPWWRALHRVAIANVSLSFWVSLSSLFCYLVCLFLPHSLALCPPSPIHTHPIPPKTNLHPCLTTDIIVSSPFLLPGRSCFRWRLSWAGSPCSARRCRRRSGPTRRWRSRGQRHGGGKNTTPRRTSCSRRSESRGRGNVWFSLEVKGHFTKFYIWILFCPSCQCNWFWYKKFPHGL